MKTLKIEKALLLLLSLFVLQACSTDDDNTVLTQESPIPDEIIIDDPGLFPTKFDFNHLNNKFMVGSVTRSNVGYIDSETGNYSVFVSDDSLVSIPEVYVDEEHNRLLVSSGDIGASANSTPEGYISIAYLGVYNLQTGEKIKGINLHELLPSESAFLANGIAVDDNGDIYVADTFAPVIYKVDGVTYEKSVFVNDSRLAPPTPNAASSGLIGLIYMNGHLIASKEDDGVLYKIPLANPTDMTKIETPIFQEAKGLELLDDGNIALVVGGAGTDFTGVRILSSDDDWDSATIASSFEISPDDKHPVATTVANNGELFAINSYFPNSFSGNLTVDFSIVKVQQ